MSTGRRCAAGFRPRRVAGRWCSAVLDLQLDDGTLRKRLSSNWRNHLNGAERGGLVSISLPTRAAVEVDLCASRRAYAGKGLFRYAGGFPDAYAAAEAGGFLRARALLDGNRWPE